MDGSTVLARFIHYLKQSLLFLYARTEVTSTVSNKTSDIHLGGQSSSAHYNGYIQQNHQVEHVRCTLEIQ